MKMLKKIFILSILLSPLYGVSAFASSCQTLLSKPEFDLSQPLHARWYYREAKELKWKEEQPHLPGVGLGYQLTKLEWGQLRYRLSNGNKKNPGTVDLNIHFLRDESDGFYGNKERTNELSQSIGRKRPINEYVPEYIPLPLNWASKLKRRFSNGRLYAHLFLWSGLNYFSALFAYLERNPIAVQYIGETGIALTMIMFAKKVIGGIILGEPDHRFLNRTLVKGQSVSLKRLQREMRVQSAAKSFNEMHLVVFLPKEMKAKQVREYYENFQKALSELVEKDEAELRGEFIYE